MIFSADKRSINQARALHKNHDHDFLLKHAVDIMCDQLAEYQCDIGDILEVDARFNHLYEMLHAFFPHANYSSHYLHNTLVPQHIKPSKLYIEQDCDLALSKIETKFDLITSIFSLHWSNDPVATLKNYHELLSDDGFLILSFLGGSTLAHFRSLLMHAELKHSSGAGRRIMPMIKFEDCPQILKHAGFSDFIVNNEIVTVNYHSIKSLCNDLRYMGEGAAFTDNAPIMTKKIIQELRLIPAFQEQFEIITITATKTRDALKKQLQLSS